MKDCNQLFMRGLDYIQAAVRNWNNRRSELCRSYVESAAFTDIPKCKDRHYLLIIELEKRIDQIFFEYRFYQKKQMEIDRELISIGLQLAK